MKNSRTTRTRSGPGEFFTPLSKRYTTSDPYTRTNEWYGFNDRGMKWLEDHGCTWEKVCAEPGDLILWDSRTPHYNLSPTGAVPRFCVYTCFLPVSEVSQGDLKRKKEAYESKSSFLSPATNKTPG